MNDLNLNKRLQRIRLILLDVDGVLTNGSVVLGSGAYELKIFNIQDGLGIRLAQAAGIEVGIITGRSSEAVERRAAELGVSILFQGEKNKLKACRQILTDLDLSIGQVCFIGDDLPDLQLIRNAGLGVTVANGCEDVKTYADYITERTGGHGAVREVIELILKSQGRWDELVQNYLGA